MESLLAALQQSQVIAMLAGLLLLFLWESLHPFYEHFRGSFKERGRHAVRNLIMGALNSALIAIVFVGLWFAASVWADQYRFGLMHWLQDGLNLPAWFHAVGAVLLFDAWSYLWHRMNHEIPFFWRFHRVHHSDSKMDVTTANRFHIGEIFFSSLFRIPLIALLGIYLWELVLYETLMFAVVQFHHSDIDIPAKIDRALRAVIVSPNMHRVHHSRWQPETDSNYSSLFSFWDRLARTFRLNPNPRSIRLGLDEFDREEDQTLGGMLKTPIEKQKRDG
ncbi:sterol desaturase family protein [Aliifodinibius sp. S!AR15-10]|uniref:sterol desaturase family protein n=1 Tax=Aliifodinibius sp. S!AR15-10 TaxID=2950437 RepID=UPI00285B38C0|nr:sterol desaturase family protein [Aliifodinibius sp. S!AR15-10]MDR8391892.1 sterol desaturase family protein [Aliifodinibius sp. S!AR15-10]